MTAGGGGIGRAYVLTVVAPVRFVGHGCGQPTGQVVYVTEQPHRRDVNHGAHLILTCLTCGCWLPVWLCICLIHAMSSGDDDD